MEDLFYAYRYREYLESAKRAQHAAWIMNASGNLRHPVRIEDLVGHWVDGQVMSKGEYFEHCKAKIQRNKEKRRKGGEWLNGQKAEY
jgi:hypothetical protein